jgi:L-arabinonolactonase
MDGAECIIAADNHIGESPVWSAREGALWWVNCELEPAVQRWDAKTRDVTTWPMPSRVGGLVLKQSGGLLLALADGVYDFDPASAMLSLRAKADLPAHVTLHECGCDRQGRFWVGSFDHRFPADRSAAGGSWFRLDGDQLTKVLDGVAVANGLAFSPDGTIMYASNTPSRTVEAFDLDPASGGLSNRRTFLSLAPGDGHIDGATVDSAGGYWLAVVGKGVLRRFDPAGELDFELALPCSNPTKAAFGDEDLASLFVTSTKLKIAPDAPGEAQNGRLFRFFSNFKGIAEPLFVG